jgi:AraC-like DNA-binding protein
MLYLPLRGMDQYQVGRRSLVSDPGTAMLLAPGWDYTCHSQPNDWLCLSVSGELLAEEIATRRRSGSRAWRCRTVALPLAPRRATELLQIHRRMLALTLAAPTAADVAAVERDAAAWLATIVLERSGEIRLARSTLLRIEQLERWIDAHLGEQVTLDSLSAASGICPRALQKAVLALRGQSPLEWVRSRRLAAVNARLQAGGARTNIAQVALDLGFTHLGRFSSLYRRAYGELPSATLAQARTRHRTREGRAPPGRRRPLQT